MVLRRSDAGSMKPPPVPPKDAQPTTATKGVAKEQKITPFDVEGGVDAEGKATGM